MDVSNLTKHLSNLLRRSHQTFARISQTSRKTSQTFSKRLKKSWKGHLKPCTKDSLNLTKYFSNQLQRTSQTLYDGLHTPYEGRLNHENLRKYHKEGHTTFQTLQRTPLTLRRTEDFSNLVQRTTQTLGRRPNHFSNLTKVVQPLLKPYKGGPSNSQSNFSY